MAQNAVPSASTRWNRWTSPSRPTSSGPAAETPLGMQGLSQEVGGASSSNARSATPLRRAEVLKPDEPLEVEGQAKHAAVPVSSSELQCTVKFLVPQALVAAKIGSESFLAGMRKSCSAQLALSDLADCKGFRVFSASSTLGEEPLQSTGCKFITRLAEHASQFGSEADTAECSTLKLHVLVPGMVVRRLLGHGGNCLKKLEQDTAVKVKIEEPGAARGPDVTQEISMSGTEEGLEQMLAEVIKQLAIANQEPWFPAWANGLEMHDVQEDSTKTKLADDHGMDSETQQCVMRFLVTRGLAGALIGKGGSFISAMQQQCQAKLRFLDHPVGRVLLAVAESEEALVKVVQQMIERLVQISDSQDEQEPLRLSALMPRAAIGGLMGSGGSAIKKLCDASGARIKVHEPETKNLGPEVAQEVAVTGDAAALEQALVEMQRIVQTYRKESWFPTWAGLVATVRMGPPAEKQGSSEHQLRNKAYTEPSLLSNKTAANKEFKAYTLPNQDRAFAFKYLISEALVPAIIGTRGRVIDSMRERCRAKLTLRQNSEQFLQTDCHVLIAMAESQDSIDRVSEQVVDFLAKAEGANSKGKLKLSVLIPRAAVGAVKGAGGQKICKLQTSTGTWIKVHDAPGTAPDVTHEVSISGLAKGLVQVLAELNLQLEAFSRVVWFESWAMTPPLNCGSVVSSAASHKKLVNDTMDGLPQALWEDARGFSMSCVVPGRLVDAIIGQGGAHLKEVQNLTNTKIHLREMPDVDSHSMNIVGPLANVASGYMLMMKRYLEAEAEVAALN